MQVLKVNNLTINRELYNVSLDDDTFMLPRKEFELLFLLASKPEKVYTREEIYQRVWHKSFTEDFYNSRTIDVHIRKLRKRLDGTFIHTVKGVGYKLLSR